MFATDRWWPTTGPACGHAPLWGHRLRAGQGCLLEEFLELPLTKAGVLNDAAHREGVDRIVARNRKDTVAIGHDDVLALAGDAEARLFELLARPGDG